MKQREPSTTKLAAKNRKLDALLNKKGKRSRRGRAGDEKRKAKGQRKTEQWKRVKVKVHQNLGEGLEDGWKQLADDDPRATEWLQAHFYGRRLKRISAVEFKSVRLHGGMAQPSLVFLHNSPFHRHYSSAADKKFQSAKRRRADWKLKEQTKKVHKKKLVRLPPEKRVRMHKLHVGHAVNSPGMGGQ